MLSISVSLRKRRRAPNSNRFAIFEVMTGQLWSIATTRIQVALKVQLNTILFAKTLLRKDVATSSSSIMRADGDEDDGEPPALNADASPTIRTATGVIGGPSPDSGVQPKEDSKPGKGGDDESNFSSKSQIMTLMTTDVCLDERCVSTKLTSLHLNRLTVFLILVGTCSVSLTRQLK